MSCWARIGTFRPAQISAESARTSAIAQYGSIAALERNMNSQSTSCVRVPSSGRSGTWETGVNGSSARRRLARMVSSDSPSTGPGFQLTFISRIASMHWPKVRARTAMPREVLATCVTPSMRRILARFSSRRGVPLSVGGRQTMVGSAPSTRRSIEKSFWPVTAARASSRSYGWPTTVKSEGSFSPTSISVGNGCAASSASSP